jgi:hypothetical protein
MDVSIPAKFYSLWSLSFREQTSIAVKKLVFLGINCLGKSVMTSALINTHNPFFAHFKANKMSIPVTYYTNLFAMCML